MNMKEYSSEVKQDLLYLLRRIETDIDIQDNAQKVWQLCERENIDADYLLQFIKNTMVKSRVVLELLAKNARI